MQSLTESCSNYKPYSAEISRPIFNRMPLTNQPTTNMALGYSSSFNMQWQLPGNTVYNLGRSYIEYSYSLPAVASQYNFTFEDNIPGEFCNYAYYGDNAALGITQLNQADRYTSVKLPLAISVEEATLRDPLTGYYSIGPVGTGVVPFPVTGLTGMTGPAFSATNLSMIAGSTGTDSILTRNRILQLSDFVNTFIGMDRNIIMPNIMYLNFQSQYISRLGFSAVAAVPYDYNLCNPISSTASVSFTNVYLYLAVETNQSLISRLKSELNSGHIKMPIPWIYTVRQSATGTSSSVNIPLTKQYGHTLKEAVYAPFNQTESGVTSFDHSNFQGLKCSQLQTAIDSSPLQSMFLNCFNPNIIVQNATTFPYFPAGSPFTLATSPFADDYRLMLPMLKGTMLGNYLSYSQKWFYMDSWSVRSFEKSKISSIPNENIYDGLPIGDIQRTYQINIQSPCVGNAALPTLGGSINNYVFLLFYRDLVITKDGIRFE